jgi:hypothetical protein
MPADILSMDEPGWDTFDALGYQLIQHRHVDDVLVLETEHLVLAPIGFTRPELARRLARWVSAC